MNNIFTYKEISTNTIEIVNLDCVGRISYTEDDVKEGEIMNLSYVTMFGFAYYISDRKVAKQFVDDYLHHWTNKTDSITINHKVNK